MFLDYYHSRGFDLFCCDHTASGEGGGKLIGYGVYESQDCLKWLEVLTERFGADVQVILHGFSMGGATVLKMSDRVPGNVRFIVLHERRPPTDQAHSFDGPAPAGD